MHILNEFRTTRYDSISRTNINESYVYKFNYAKFAQYNMGSWMHTVVHLLVFMCMCIELEMEAQTASTNLNIAKCNTHAHKIQRVQNRKSHSSVA